MCSQVPNTWTLPEGTSTTSGTTSDGEPPPPKLPVYGRNGADVAILVPALCAVLFLRQERMTRARKHATCASSPPFLCPRAGFDYTVWPGQVDPVNGLVVDEIRLLIRCAPASPRLAPVFREQGGDPWVSPLSLLTRPTDKQSIEEFGKPESINFSSAYGLKEGGFARADILGVTVRKARRRRRRRSPAAAPPSPSRACCAPARCASSSTSPATLRRTPSATSFTTGTSPSRP